MPHKKHDPEQFGSAITDAGIVDDEPISPLPAKNKKEKKEKKVNKNFVVIRDQLEIKCKNFTEVRPTLNDNLTTQTPIPLSSPPSPPQKSRRHATTNDVGSTMEGAEINPDFVHSNRRGHSEDRVR